jgi:hypothetical protein
MAARNDITGSVRLTDVESVSIRDTAVAEIVMRGGRADDVHFARVSVTERIDFDGGRFTGSAHFDQVESLGEVTLNGSESTGALHFEGCAPGRLQLRRCPALGATAAAWLRLRGGAVLRRNGSARRCHDRAVGDHGRGLVRRRALRR